MAAVRIALAVLALLVAMPAKAESLDRWRPYIEEASARYGVPVEWIERVMRAESGLDSVAQAAGRCNREGRQTAEGSKVYVFAADEQWKMPSELALQAAAMRAVVRRQKSDLLAPEAIGQYFQELYSSKGAELDSKRILQEFSDNGTNFPFQTAAEKFRMIENHMLPVIVPFDEEAEKRINQLRHAEYIGSALRNGMGMRPSAPSLPSKLNSRILLSVAP